MQPIANNQQQSTKNQELSPPREVEGEVMVKVEGVSKKFCRDLKKSLWYGVKDIAHELLPIKHSTSNIQNSGDALRPGEFWANKDISFELRRGECIGLIGHNGAGKTTLLKMLNGLIKPDFGSIEISGRVGALIALGAGFNPILTGRENIYIAGSVYGLSKSEIDSQLDNIIEFAEIRDFIDSPVQNYSSGMQVRLGFSVATSLKPDVLILDEVLAVGDAAFRNKCYRRVAELREKAAVIFVSHSMANISRMCDTVLLLEHGKLAYRGAADEGVRRYEMLESGATSEAGFCEFSEPLSHFQVDLVAEKIPSGESALIRIKCAASSKVDQFVVRLVMYDTSGTMCVATDIRSDEFGAEIQIGDNEFDIVVPHLSLRRGNYALGLNILAMNGDILAWSYKQAVLEVEGGTVVMPVSYQPAAKLIF